MHGNVDKTALVHLELVIVRFQWQHIMSTYQQLPTRLQAVPCTWLVAGVAVFIGSNLAATQVKLDQRMDMRDTFIAGIVLVRPAPIATRNVPYFDKLKVAVSNPWSET